MPEIKYAQLFAPPRQQAQQDPQTLRQQMLMHALQTAGSSEPIYSPAVGVGKLALGALAGWQMGQQERDAAAQKQAAIGGISDYLKEKGFLTPGLAAAIRGNPSLGEGAAAALLGQGINPQIHAVYDPATGRKANMVWTPGGYQPVGGVETDTKSPEAIAQEIYRKRQEGILDPAAVAQQKDIKSAGQILPQQAVDQKISIAAAGKPDTTINNAINPIIKGIGDQFMEQRAAAKAAADNVTSLYQARSQLQQGVKSGAGADLRLQAAKIGSFLGLPDAAIANTETFKAAAGRSVLDLVKGLGAGSSISNADREFAEKMSGGSVALDAESLDRINKIAEQAARDKIKQYNDQAESLYKGMPELEKFRGAMNIPAPGGYDEYLAAHPELMAPAAAGAAGAVPPPAMPSQVPGQPAAVDPLGLFR